MNYWVQEYSLVRKDWVTAKNFHGGVGGGQRIVTDNEADAKRIFEDFVKNQEGKGYAVYRLTESHWEGRFNKSKAILTKTVK